MATTRDVLIFREWTRNMKLQAYYGHTREWWGQAIWFYNKLNRTELDAPSDIFDVVERAGVADAIPSDYRIWSARIMDYWIENSRMAELVLPEH